MGEGVLALLPLLALPAVLALLPPGGGGASGVRMLRGSLPVLRGWVAPASYTTPDSLPSAATLAQPLEACEGVGRGRQGVHRLCT